MAVLSYTTNATEDAVLVLIAAQGSQTVADYFSDFVRSTLENLRLENLSAERVRVLAEVDRALLVDGSFTVTKDRNTGLPVITRN